MRNVEYKSASGNARVMRMGFGMAKTALRAHSSPWWRKNVRGTRPLSALGYLPREEDERFGEDVL